MDDFCTSVPFKFFPLFLTVQACTYGAEVKTKIYKSPFTFFRNNREFVGVAMCCQTAQHRETHKKGGGGGRGSHVEKTPEEDYQKLTPAIIDFSNSYWFLKILRQENLKKHTTFNLVIKYWQFLKEGIKFFESARTQLELKEDSR